MARASEGNEQLLCSFCGKSQRQVKKLIAGPGVYICDECIDLCNEIIDEELTAPPSFDIENLPKPREIYNVLNTVQFTDIDRAAVFNAQGVQTKSTFGTALGIQSPTAPPRVMQLAARFMF